MLRYSYTKYTTQPELKRKADGEDYHHTSQDIPKDKIGHIDIEVLGETAQ